MHPAGEIIESTTTWFTAAAYQLLEAPAFGSLVRAQTRTNGMTIYGLVYEIRTGSREPGGRAIMRGRTYTGRTFYNEEIYQEHPDLIEVLQTEFSAITVGFAEHNQLYQYLPPHPPPVHYSVYECSTDELASFTTRCDFFRSVLFAAYVPADELLAATIRAASRTQKDSYTYLVQVGRQLANLLKDDYDRLIAILRRLRP